MSKNKGLDHGYLYTKDSDRNIFRSEYTKSGICMGSTPFISINGVNFSVGVGDRNIQNNKCESEMNYVTTLTNLSMCNEDSYNLVVGLPIDQYKAQCEKFKETILSYNGYEVIYKGKLMNFVINDVYVLPQGIGALLSMKTIPDGNVIIFDWGGMTIDIAYIEFIYGNPKLIKSVTWAEGIQKIYGKLIGKVNEKYDLTLNISEAENILVHGLFIDGTEVSLEFLTDTISEYVAPIVRDFKVNFPAVTTQIYMTGGTSTIKLIYCEFIKYFMSAKIIDNSQFANAIGYGNVAEQRFASMSKPIYVSNPTMNCGRR